MKGANLLLVAVVLALASVRGDELGAQVDAAAAPLQAGVPEAAIARLRVLFAAVGSDDGRRAVGEKLGEALVIARRGEEALRLLEQPFLRDSVPAKFWRAQALALLGRAAEASTEFREVAGAPNRYQSAAIYGEAEMFRTTGRRAEATKRYADLLSDPEFGPRARSRSAELLIDANDLEKARRLIEEAEPKVTAEKRERRYLRGRLELASNRADRAVEIFTPLIRDADGTPHDVMIGALVALADAHVALRTPEAGDDFLEDYIEHHPTDAALSRVFARLDRLYTMERRPGRGDLERWARDAAQPRRALAQWYVARLELRGGRHDRAVRDFEELARTERPPVEAAPGLLEYAELKMAERDYYRAVEVLEIAADAGSDSEVAARVQFALGRAHELAGDAEGSAAAFEEARTAGGPFAQSALFNASLAWLQAGDDAAAQRQSSELPEAARADFRLEEGLSLARRNDSRATEALRTFVRDYAKHPRVSEAHVALAELAFHASPARPEEVRDQLKRAMQAQPTAVARERADYLAVWLAEADDKIIAAASAFLRDHADSRFSPDVRMKLAETYFRRQDFANAQTQFELLAQRNADSPFTDKALFFAAQCAVASFEPHAVDRALSLLGQVVRSQSDLKWAARNQQASIERRLGKLDEALVLYDEVLKSDARPADKREATCGKGDIFLERGATDAANYARAIDCYAQLAGDSSASAHWRNQALFKQAVCVEKQGKRDEAVATYYRVLESNSRDKAAEFFWFYKAGFDAARLLEESASWESAGKIYERLAAAGGARSDEAKKQLDRLRLEHFLWTD